MKGKRYVLVFGFFLIVAAAFGVDASTYIIEQRITGNLSTQNVTLDWLNITGIPAGFADGVDDVGAGGGGGGGSANIINYTSTLINYSSGSIDTIEDYYLGGGINTTVIYTGDLITNLSINNNGSLESINITYTAGLVTQVLYG